MTRACVSLLLLWSINFPVHILSWSVGVVGCCCWNRKNIISTTFSHSSHILSWLLLVIRANRPKNVWLKKMTKNIFVLKGDFLLLGENEKYSWHHQTSHVQNIWGKCWNFQSGRRGFVSLWMMSWKPFFLTSHTIFYYEHFFICSYPPTFNSIQLCSVSYISVANVKSSSSLHHIFNHDIAASWRKLKIGSFGAKGEAAP